MDVDWIDWRFYYCTRTLIFKPSKSGQLFFAPVYALFEGVFIGAISAMRIIFAFTQVLKQPALPVALLCRQLV